MLWPTGSFSWEQQHTAVPPFPLIHRFQCEYPCFTDQRTWQPDVYQCFPSICGSSLIHDALPSKPAFLDAWLHIYAWIHSIKICFNQTKTLIVYGTFLQLFESKIEKYTYFYDYLKLDKFPFNLSKSSGFFTYHQV
jgi:hypothetical protein